MWIKRAWLCAILFSLLFLTSAFAAEVSQDSARTVAQNWIHHLTKENRLADYASGTRQIAGEEVIFHKNMAVGYNFLLYPSGHIVVPIRDELPPVKFYSHTTTLRMTDDSQVVEWIKEELYKLNEALDAHSAELATIDHRMTHNGKLWTAYKADSLAFSKAYEAAPSASESLSLGPLLSTAWGQGTPYNNYTPLWFTGERTVTGCVATAAAQIMKYWNYPAMGQGFAAYSWWNGAAWTTLSRDFSASTYNWSLMKNAHTTGDTAAEQDAVARLMSDVGVAFHMDYGPASSDGSAANTMSGVTVFPTYFKYANTISAVYRTSYPSDSTWMQVFKNEVQNGRPSQLRIRDPNAGGHSVVVDGYRDYPTEQIHINMGWKGNADLWYVANNIAAAGFTFSDVNYQAAVVGIRPGPPTILTLTANLASPQVVGTAITFTATAAGGAAPYQYKWWVHNGSTWSIGQDWGTSATFAWTPTSVGSYTIEVWARSNGTTNDAPRASSQLSYTITPPPPTVSLTTNLASPQGVGTLITFFATSAWVTNPVYRFWLYDGTSWTLLRDWGPGNNYTWIPTTAGNYQVFVWVKPSTTPGDGFVASNLLPFVVTPPTVSLTANLASPQGVGTPITFFATPAWITNPVYRFWLYDGTSWTLVRDWGAGATYTWTPSTAGSYKVGVWVKPSTMAGDVFVATHVLPFVVAPAVTLTANPASPQFAGTPITVTATLTGATAPYQCKWWLTANNWQTYNMVQDWGACSTPWVWTPTTSGSYLVGVWVKPSTMAGDVFVATRTLPFVVTPPTVALTAAPSSSQVVGTPITATATSTGVTSPVYRFWLYNGTTWTLLRDWEAGDTYIWTPSTAGSYKVGVWVKPSTMAGDVSVAYSNLPYTITPPTVALTAAPSSPQVVGMPITVAAAITGGIAPQCKWWLSTTTWQVVQGWGACSTPLVWTPTTPGSYSVGVWVRSGGNGADTPEAIAVLPFTATPMGVTLTALPSAPQAVGTPITVTPTLTGGIAPQCKWWLSTTTWQVAQGWGACSTPWVWTPTTPGSYRVGVWVRSAGNGADTPEAVAVLPFAVTP